VVRLADKIAYLGRDIEDAITIGLITGKDVPLNLKKNLGSTNGEIIDTLVLDVVKHSAGKDRIALSDNKFDLICQLRDFNYKSIYNHPIILKSDKAISSLLSHLFQHLYNEYKTNGDDLNAYEKSSFLVDRYFGQFHLKRAELYRSERFPERCIVDFVAGMTDSFALESAREILFPQTVDYHTFP